MSAPAQERAHHPAVTATHPSQTVRTGTQQPCPAQGTHSPAVLQDTKSLLPGPILLLLKGPFPRPREATLVSKR